MVQEMPSALLEVLRPFFANDAWDSFATSGTKKVKRGDRWFVAYLAAQCWQQIASYASDFAENCWALANAELEKAMEQDSRGRLNNATGAPALRDTMNHFRN